MAVVRARFHPAVAEWFRRRFPDGRWTGLYRHVLKVFLLDRAHRVRNVYSTGLLDAGLVLNDVKTLLME